MTVVIVTIILFFPIPFLELKPLPKSDRVGSISDIGADSPDPPPLSAENAARLRRALGPSYRSNVRSEVARRKLDIRTDRVAALCECSLDVLIEANGGNSEREEFRERSEERRVGQE